MSNAKEKAMQYCCTKCANNKLNCGMKLLSHGRNCIACSNYIEGYNQAEKDLELTWEDCARIDDIAIRLDGLEEVRYMTNKEFYQEVLKQFKLQKENEL